MSQVIITPSAQEGLNRCRIFLEEKNLEAAKRAAEVINQKIMLLETTPNMGAPYDPDFPDVRELRIPFGASGYVALYWYEPADDAVYVLAFRHQKEVGF